MAPAANAAYPEGPSGKPCRDQQVAQAEYVGSWQPRRLWEDVAEPGQLGLWADEHDVAEFSGRVLRGRVLGEVFFAFCRDERLWGHRHLAPVPDDNQEVECSTKPGN